LIYNNVRTKAIERLAKVRFEAQWTRIEYDRIKRDVSKWRSHAVSFICQTPQGQWKNDEAIGRHVYAKIWSPQSKIKQ